MNQNIATFIASLKKVGPKDLIYPGLLTFFLVIVFTIFLIATGFISKNINKAISSEDHGESYSLNIENYTFVAKRLGIVANTPSNESTTTETKEVPAVNIQATSTIDKASLSITILNSTTKTGIATALSKSLEASGFAKATTGNEKKLYATTTVMVNEIKKGYATSLLDAVRKTYPNAVATTTVSGTTDVTIIIGAH